jgi:hypothetical protein
MLRRLRSGEIAAKRQHAESDNRGNSGTAADEPFGTHPASPHPRGAARDGRRNAAGNLF